MHDIFTSKEEKEKGQQNLIKIREENKRMEIMKMRAERDEQLKKSLPPLPNKKYQVIYMDPPWRYNFSRSVTREIENQYPTMELEEIKALPINRLAEDDSVLFLWATSPKLEEALQVINAYGFKYITSAVWDKVHIGMGYYFRSRHEYLLIGKKGSLPVPKPENRPASIINIPREKHSKKPVEFYVIIEKMYPDATKIEIFSRINKKGWDTWGYEAGDLPAPEYNKILLEKWEE